MAMLFSSLADPPSYVVLHRTQRWNVSPLCNKMTFPGFHVPLKQWVFLIYPPQMRPLVMGVSISLWRVLLDYPPTLVGKYSHFIRALYVGVNEPSDP